VTGGSGEWDDPLGPDPLAADPSLSDDPLNELSSGPASDSDPLDPFADTGQDTFTATPLEPPRRTRSRPFRRHRRLVAGILTLLSFLFAASLLIRDGGDPEPDWTKLARSVVLVMAPDCGWGGSGTIVLDGGHVLTNAHVALRESGQPCDLEVWAAESPNSDPEWLAFAQVAEGGIDIEHDLAVLRLFDQWGNPTKAEDRAPIPIGDRELEVGEEIKVLGFPGMGGIKITITPGEQSGWWTGAGDGWTGEFYKTSAKMGPGVSGGAAFSALTGEFVGVPTGGSSSSDDEGDTLGLIRPNIYVIPLLDRVERSNS
tara:strand:- start:13203 stop:14144 length:942 start_codon:yes stop_codon:yes gene_type:complete